MQRGARNDQIFKCLMSQTEHPLPQALTASWKPCPRSLAPHHPSDILGSPPIKRETQKIECAWTFARLLLTPWFPKGKQPRFVRVKRQTVLAHSLPEHRHHSVCIILPFKSDDEVIRVSHEHCFSREAGTDLFLEPDVQGVMQVDVSQQPRED